MLGRGTFGLVVAAEYHKTPVAVKRALPTTLSSASNPIGSSPSSRAKRSSSSSTFDLSNEGGSSNIDAESVVSSSRSVHFASGRRPSCAKADPPAPTDAAARLSISSATGGLPDSKSKNGTRTASQLPQEQLLEPSQARVEGGVSRSEGGGAPQMQHLQHSCNKDATCTPPSSSSSASSSSSYSSSPPPPPALAPPPSPPHLLLLLFLPSRHICRTRT